MVNRLIPIFCVKIRDLKEMEKYGFTSALKLLNKYPYMSSEWVLVYTDGESKYIEGHTFLFSYYYNDIEEDLEICKKRFPHLFI